MAEQHSNHSSSAKIPDEDEQSTIKKHIEDDKEENEKEAVEEESKLLEDEHSINKFTQHQDMKSTNNNTNVLNSRLSAHHQDVIKLNQQNPQLPQQPYNQHSRKISVKFQEALLAEKQRKFKRVVKVFGKRTPQPMKCPSCNKEGQTKLKHECTGNQWCVCIALCFFGLYPLCCVPFCVKKCYNVKHVCPYCHAQIGESGVSC